MSACCGTLGSTEYLLKSRTPRETSTSSSIQKFPVFFFASLVHSGCFVGVYGLLSDEGTMTSYGAVLAQATANAAIGVAVTVAIRMGPGAFERRVWRRGGLSRRFGGGFSRHRVVR